MSAHQIVFQPIVRLADWQVIGYEALARFDDGRSPLAHLRDAREAGRLVEFELGLVETALEGGRILPPEHLITLNVSVETVFSDGLREALARDTSHEWGLELSEMSEVVAYDELRSVVRDLGAVLLIDDAGARHSDLERIAQAQPSIVKIDKGILLAAMDEVVPDVTGLWQFREAASAVGALALAEGVENPTQARLLLEYGYELGQGYLFGHPGTAEDWAARG